MSDDKLLWKAFLAGFRESGEGWNGEVAYWDNPESVERRLKAKFEALREADKIESLVPAGSGSNSESASGGNEDAE
jgi:hypothetical protein